MVETSHTAGRLQMYRVADWFAPKAEGATAEDGYEFGLELPGVATDNVEILVQDGTLTLTGEKQLDREEKGRTYFFSEREYAHFSARCARRPMPSADRIDAVFNNAVFTIRIPKIRAAAADSRRIAIRTELPGAGRDPC